MTDIAFTTEGGGNGNLVYENIFVRLSDGALYIHASNQWAKSSLTPLRSAEETGLTNGTTDLAAAITAVQAVEPS